MCGILSIINLRKAAGAGSLISACNIIKHRGPDDEGFLTWNVNETPKVWAGEDTATSTRQYWQYQTLNSDTTYTVGFGHRRLSILDLSPAGHQPMLFKEAKLALTFNGEIYNYIEIKAELEAQGHRFETKTDTEVILHAWAQWGASCLSRFNGMFSFVILDYKANELYAVRDRFGVKPLYWYKNNDQIVLSSEIKQVKNVNGFLPVMNEHIVRQYLATGAVDHTSHTFDVNINHIPGGHYLYVNLNDPATDHKIKMWYELKPQVWSGSEDKAVDRFRELLTDSVKLRLRSDVTVGSCLSGGLDSSAIVCLAAGLLKDGGNYAGQETVTACYENAKYDEWRFAEEVIKKTNAHPHKTFPSFNQLQADLSAFLWHQDEPTGSTSQFSQWAVFKKTHEVGLKVMIDGQGADEQLAGYGSNDIAYYAGLMRKARMGSLYDEALHYKKEKGNWPYGFLLGALRSNTGKLLVNTLPHKYRQIPPVADWVNPATDTGLYRQPARSLQENLRRQIYTEPLPGLLRYEDRNSMAWSVESRTPFMDYRLIEFTMGLPERFVYHRGVRKTILRKAMDNILPAAIANRKDKMGFVTPEETWLKGEGKEWFLKGIKAAGEQFGTFVAKDKLQQHVDNIITGKEEFSFLPWRILCFYEWQMNLKTK